MRVAALTLAVVLAMAAIVMRLDTYVVLPDLLLAASIIIVALVESTTKHEVTAPPAPSPRPGAYWPPDARNRPKAGNP